MIKLYITRHGKALSNENKIAASTSEKHCGGLSKLGEKQAEELVPELLKHEYDVIIISPMIRTFQTLMPYLKTFTYPPKMIISDLVLERDIGELRGKTIGEVKDIIKKSKNKVSWTPPNGESIIEVYARAKEFVSYLKKNFEGKSILLCGHMVFLRSLEAFFKEVDINDIYSIEEPQHGVVKEYVIK